MLDPHYLLTVGDSLANQFFELETEILIDIAKRLKANDLNMVSTAQYQIMKLQQLGLQTDYINQMLAQLLGVSEEQVAQIMNDSAYESIREDMKIYKEADMLDGRTVDLTEQVKAGTNALKGELTNLCQTTVQTANKRYMDLMDKAYLSVSSGLLSPQQATDQAIKELAKDGLQMVDYKSGAHRQLDSAVRVAVRTATTKNACACQEQVMDDLDVNLVEVSSHMGARPSHAKWQGKIYWRKKKYGNYKNFEDATRYGHGDGLGGWNCRHQFYPYIPGVSEKTYEPYRLTENKEQYDLEQKQRYNERMIREWKRRQQIMESAGLDSTYERSKVREWQKKNKALIDAHSDILKRDYSREKAYLASTEKKPTMTVSGKTAPEDKQERLRKNLSRQEKERIHIPDTGKNVPGHVNTKVVNKKIYHDKFDDLTGRKATDESLYDNTLQVLLDNNDTGHEHILAIDARKGTLLVKNTSHADVGLDYQCGFSEEEAEYLSSLKIPFVVLHNHPNNSIPSRDDIQMLFKRPYQDGSVIPCHNGDVYGLKKLKEFKNIDTLVGEVYHEVKEKYQDYSDDKIEYECSVKLIKLLKRGGVLGYDKR